METPTEESPQQNGLKKPSKMVLSANDSIMHTTFLDGNIVSIESASQKAWEVVYLFRYFIFLTQITSCTDILCHFLSVIEERRWLCSENTDNSKMQSPEDVQLEHHINHI